MQVLTQDQIQQVAGGALDVRMPITRPPIIVDPHPCPWDPKVGQIGGGIVIINP